MYTSTICLHFYFSHKLLIYIFNTFASQRLVFEQNNEPFLLENASNLTNEFLYDNFNKKIYQDFFVKIVTQKLTCEILCIFKEK